MCSLSLTVRIIFTLCFAALLAVASLTPPSPRLGDTAFVRLITRMPTLVQKALHVCLYGVLALLLAWTLEGIPSETFRLLISFTVAVGFGAVMEWCQTKVPGRFGASFDVALNAAGAGFGLLAAVYLL